MRAGKLDRTIALQQLTEAVSPAGTVTTAWATFATVRAELVGNTITEAGYAFGEADADARVFRIRFRPDLTNSVRVIYDGRAFDIAATVEIGRRRGIQLSCEAVS